MASYEELRDLFNDSSLINRVAVAVIVAAEGILNEATPVTARKTWAAKAFANPETEAKRIITAVLAANKGATVADIKAVTDVQIQANVDAAIDLFIDADAGV